VSERPESQGAAGTRANVRQKVKLAFVLFRWQVNKDMPIEQVITHFKICHSLRGPKDDAEAGT